MSAIDSSLTFPRWWAPVGLTVALCVANLASGVVVAAFLSSSVIADGNVDVHWSMVVSALVLGLVGALAAVAGSGRALSKAGLRALLLVAVAQVSWAALDGIGLFDQVATGSSLAELMHRSSLGVLAGYFVVPMLLCVLLIRIRGEP